MYQDCLRYCAAVRRMMNPLVDADMAQLNAERAELHDKLCASYDVTRAKTEEITDDMPDLTVEKQAEWLDAKLDALKRKQAWDRGAILYHDGWEYIPFSNDVLDKDVKTRLCASLDAYHAWFKTRCMKDKCMTDGATRDDMERRFCVYMADIADLAPQRIRKARAFITVRNAHCLENLPPDDWNADTRDYWASRMGLRGSDLLKFLKETQGMSWDEVSERLEKLVIDNARRRRDEFNSMQEADDASRR